ncbi:hypothetical protein R3P38DRAFT_2790358 [Favolaschia claudopus]|uniref:Uncharacterized protein n=1 Tax=Favolaschia claudopus TaxID=2862362 RepID=A0AAW0AIU7_9AGAR
MVWSYPEQWFEEEISWDMELPDMGGSIQIDYETSLESSDASKTRSLSRNASTSLKVTEVGPSIQPMGWRAEYQAARRKAQEAESNRKAKGRAIEREEAAERRGGRYEGVRASLRGAELGVLKTLTNPVDWEETTGSRRAAKRFEMGRRGARWSDRSTESGSNVKGTARSGEAAGGECGVKKWVVSGVVGGSQLSECKGVEGRGGVEMFLTLRRNVADSKSCQLLEGTRESEAERRRSADRRSQSDVNEFVSLDKEGVGGWAASRREIAGEDSASRRRRREQRRTQGKRAADGGWTVTSLHPLEDGQSAALLRGLNRYSTKLTDYRIDSGTKDREHIFEIGAGKQGSGPSVKDQMYGSSPGATKSVGNEDGQGRRIAVNEHAGPEARVLCDQTEDGLSSKVPHARKMMSPRISAGNTSPFEEAKKTRFLGAECAREDITK